MSTSKMTPAAASRIQSATARQHDGITPKGSFASRAQSKAASSSSNPKGGGYPSKTGNPSGGGRTNNPSKSK